MTGPQGIARMTRKVVNRLRREVRHARAFARAKMFDMEPDAEDVLDAWRQGPVRADLQGCIAEWIDSRPVLFPADLVPSVNLAAACHQAGSVMTGQIRILQEPCTLKLPGSWHVDPLTQQPWPAPVHFTRFKVFHPSGDGVTDIRRLWEVGRFGWALPLAQAFVATGRVEYVRSWADYVKSFIENNPPEFGPHWLNGMEVALRAIQWCRALACVFSKVDALPAEWRSDPSVLADVLPSLLVHGRYIHTHLEWTPWGRTNHYLANLAGLLALGVFVPQFREATEWRELAIHGLVREMEIQTDIDGFHSEASTAYHHFALDLYRFVAALDQPHRLGLPPRFHARVKQMAEVDSFIRGIENRDPQIGDDDSGSLEMPNAECRMPNLQSSCPLFHAGFYVLRSRELSCHIACGPNGQQGVGGHAHNDKLSVVVRLRGTPVIIDAGTACYSANLTRRDEFRSTASHNTVMVDDEEQNALTDWRKLHDRTHARCTVWRDTSSETFFSGEHRGYHLLRVIHRRTVQLDKRHPCLYFVDELDGHGVHVYEFRLHFAPELTRPKIHLEEGRVRLPGAELIFKEDLPLELVASTCSPVYGRQVPNLCLHAHARAFGKWTLPWEFRPV